MSKRPKRSSQSSRKPRSKPPATALKSYYPAFLLLEGKKCVVVGGGAVAERKVASLLKAGASVRVVSPALTSGLIKKKDTGIIKHTARRFRKGDVKGAALAIAATDSYRENERVAEDAGRENVLINVVDTPELCGFIVPSTVRRGPLQIAISTSGASPAMAKAIRKEVETLYGPEFGQYLNKCAAHRKKALAENNDPASRARALKEAGSAQAIRRIRKKG